MKRVVKHLLQEGVASLAPFTWKRGRPSLLILMYHRVLPLMHPERKSEQPGMFVSPETLRMHVEELRKQFTILHLDDWLESAERRLQLPHNACAITFDDGWRDNFEHAFPILRAAKAPATIYLVSALVGTRYSFWPNLLARLLRADPAARAVLPAWLETLVREHEAAGAPQSDVVDSVIAACKALKSDSQMQEALRDATGRSPVPAERDLMNWDEIKEMQASGLIRFGSHTRQHTRLLASVDKFAIENEIIGSRQEIAQNLGVEPRTFCYPNGDLSPAAVACVRGAYRGAVTTRQGWNGLDADRALLRRVGVHEDVSSTRASFLSRLAGIG